MDEDRRWKDYRYLDGLNIFCVLCQVANVTQEYLKFLHLDIQQAERLKSRKRRAKVDRLNGR